MPPNGRSGSGARSEDNWSLGSAEAAVRARLDAWSRGNATARIWRRDPSFWPTATPPDVAGGLGWLAAPAASRTTLAELKAFGDDVAREGFAHVLLLGMGGSSLAPEVIGAILPHGPGHPELLVLDSTHPAAARDALDRAPVERTLYLVSSKSGTTLEPNVFFRFFWERAQRLPQPGRRFVAVTDPGTPLEKLATEHAFRACLRAPHDVGGRYSALTVFGLLPAALLGADLEALIGPARQMAARCSDPTAAADNPGLRLGAALGELWRAGRDKVVFVTSPTMRPFPAWAEQLIAESLGKHGRGIVPVASVPPGTAIPEGPDVVLVRLGLAGEEDPQVEETLDRRAAKGVPVLRLQIDSPLDLGAEFFRWEFAIAACGSVLEVDPFDQPDVEHAKELAREAMAQPVPTGSEAAYGLRLGPAAKGALEAWCRSVEPRDYVAVQAFLAPAAGTEAALGRVASALESRLGTVVTVGYGPRFLHSTGQLHKGGPPSGAFLQIVDEPEHDEAVPGLGLSFAGILRAQARGDDRALEEAHRRVVVVNTGPRPADGLETLVGLLRDPGGKP